MRSARFLLLLATVLFSGRASFAADACPCIPLTHLWVVKTCNDWPCASTELLLANGDPQVIAMPVAIGDARWLIVRRFTAGGAINASDDPFSLKQFDGMSAAVDHYRTFTADQRPMLLTAPDGQVLVIGLRQPEVARRRAVAH
jgi:hypothetical protein